MANAARASSPQVSPHGPAILEESRRIRRLQFLVRLTLQTVAQGDLPYEEASRLVASTRRVALEMFPGKEGAFELLYQPPLRRMLAWRYRLQ